MRGDDAVSRGGDPVSVVAAHDELADGAAGGFLHGDAFGLSSFAERRLFVVRQAKRHGHDRTVSV